MTLSNFNIKQKKLDTVTLTNLKQTLKSFEFEDTISLQCIDNKDIDCLLVIDNELQEERIKGLFKECPDVYEYSKDQIKIEFASFEIKHLEELPICFKFTLDKFDDSSSMIVETNQKVFIYDNISLKPKVIKYLNDISIYFDDKINEVKDAF